MGIAILDTPCARIPGGDDMLVRDGAGRHYRRRIVDAKTIIPIQHLKLEPDEGLVSSCAADRPERPFRG